MRINNWPTIIAKGIQAHENTPFVWGSKDCCLTVADILKDYTGEDYAAEFRGKYKTAKGSLMALKKYGKGDLRSTMSAKLPTIEVCDAVRGDLALVKTEAGESLGLVFNQRVWAMSPTGLSALPMTSVVCAWRVE